MNGHGLHAPHSYHGAHSSTPTSSSNDLSTRPPSSSSSSSSVASSPTLHHFSSQQQYQYQYHQQPYHQQPYHQRPQHYPMAQPAYLPATVPPLPVPPAALPQPSHSPPPTTLPPLAPATSSTAPATSSSSSSSRPSGKKKISRLRSGCWTCRRRGYKCDEAKPCCNNCTRLSLKCEGYAIRLKWQDDGYFYQSHIANGKSVISIRNNRRKVSSSSSSVDPADPQPSHVTLITAHPPSPSPAPPTRLTGNTVNFKPHQSAQYVSDENPDGTIKFFSFNGNDNTFAPAVQLTNVFSTLPLDALALDDDQEDDDQKTAYSSPQLMPTPPQQQQAYQQDAQPPFGSYHNHSFGQQHYFSTIPNLPGTSMPFHANPQGMMMPPPRYPSGSPPPPLLPTMPIASELLRRIIVDLGDRCTLQISSTVYAQALAQSQPQPQPQPGTTYPHYTPSQVPPPRPLPEGRMMVEHAAARATQTGDARHPFNRYRDSFAIVAAKSPGDTLPALPVPVASIEALTEDPAVLAALTAYFRNHVNVSYNVPLSGDYYSRTFTALSETFEPLRYAIASLAAQSLATRYLLMGARDDDSAGRGEPRTDDFVQAQVDAHQALSVSLKIRALNRLGAAIVDGVSEQSLACILVLSNIEMGELNFETWGRHLEGAAHGVMEYLARHGEDRVMGSARPAQPDQRYRNIEQNGSRESGPSFDVFLAILELVGVYDIMWTVSTDSRPRLQDVYARHWRYFPDGPAAYPSSTPYATAVRYLVTFIGEIAALSGDISAREASQAAAAAAPEQQQQQYYAQGNPFAHLAGDAVSQFYFVDPAALSPADVALYLDLRARLSAFGPRFLDHLPRIPYLHSLARFIYTAVKIYFVLRLDTGDMATAAAAGSDAAPYELAALKREAFAYLRDINPQLRTGASYQSVQDFERFLYRTQPCGGVTPASAADYSGGIPPPPHYDPTLCPTNNNTGETRGPREVEEETVERLHVFKTSVDPVTQIRGSAVWMLAMVADTRDEQALLRDNLHELYARLPKHSFGYLLGFCELMWRLKPAVDSPQGQRLARERQQQQHGFGPGAGGGRAGDGEIQAVLRRVVDAMAAGGGADTAATVVFDDEDGAVRPEYLRLFACMSRRDIMALIVHTCGPFISI